MRIGVVLVPSVTWREMLDSWRAVDEIGVDHGWVFDHFVWSGEPERALRSAIPVLSAVAQCTSQIQLGTLVATPNFRHPVNLAHELATLDEISGSRVIAGLGAGGGLDADALVTKPLSPEERRARFAEFVTIYQRSLRERFLTADGIYYRANNATIWPSDVSPPRPPLWIAGSHRESIELACRIADGWITTGGVGGTADRWWLSVDRAVRRFDRAAGQLLSIRKSGRPFRRALLAEAESLDTFGSARQFRSVVGHAEDLGFTDIIFRWSYAAPDRRAQLRLLSR